MAGYPRDFSRATRQGLTKGSGWDTLAASAFFTPSPANQAANTFNDLTSVASGAHTVGTGAATLDALTSTSAGAIGAKGTSAVTLAAITSTASGATVTGTSSATLATIVSAGAGTSAGGSSAVTLSALTSSASGARGAAGTSAVTLATIVSAGAGQVTILGSVASTLDALTSVGSDAPPPVAIIFDDGTIPALFYWSEIGTGTVVDRADATGGTAKALQFPDIEDFEDTYFEIYVNAREGNNSLTVRYEVSSEENYDFLRVYVDGVHVLYPSGSDNSSKPGRSGTGEGWVEFTASLAVGARLIKFAYSKDSSADDGDDTAWLSKIIAPALAERPVTATNTLEALTSDGAATTQEYPGLYRFWRVRFQFPNDPNPDVSVQEMEMRGSPGGPNLCSGGTAFASSTFVSASAANAFDGDTTTPGQVWEPSSFTQYVSLGYEFNYPQGVQEIAIWPGFYTDDAPRDFEVEYSETGENDHYHTIARFRGETGWLRYGVRAFDLVGANRHWDAYWGQAQLFNSVLKTFVQADYVSVYKFFVSVPTIVTRMVAFSRTQMPYNPVGLPVTHTTFKCRGVIYNDDGAVAGDPGTLVATTNEITNTYPNDPSRTDNDRRLGCWFTLTFPAGWAILPPGEYYMGLQIGGDQEMYGADMPNASGAYPAYTAGAVYASGAPATFPLSPTSMPQKFPVYLVYPESDGLSTLADATSSALGFHGQAITGTAELILEALTGEATGIYILPITGTAGITLGAMLSDATGARGVFRPRESLYGTYRPELSLNATWVER